MAIIDTVRPFSTLSGGGWSIDPSGTVHGVLSDDNNTTFILQPAGASSPVQVRCGPHSLTAGYRRHRARLRIRASADGSGGSVTAQVRFLSTSGVLSAVGSGQAFGILGDDTWRDYTMAWRSSAAMPTTGTLPPAGNEPTLLGQITMGQFSSPGGVAVAEMWLDVDTRHAPTFTPEVIDGGGTVRTNSTVTDTVVPRFVYGPIDYDGLPARNWQMFVYTLAQTLTSGFAAFSPVWTAQAIARREGAGLPPIEIGIPLPNDDYVAYMAVRSNVGAAAEAFPSIGTVAFELAAIPPEPPADVTATVDEDRAAVDVCWEFGGSPGSPGSPGDPTDWSDSSLIVAEVQRSTCDGEWETIQNLDRSPDGCWRDRFMPLLNESREDCHDTSPGSPGECMVQYRVRYWGLVTTFVMATDWTYSDPVQVANPSPGNDWLRHPVDGDLDMPICVTRSYTRIRPFSATQPIGGGLPTVVTGAPGGRDYTLAISVRTVAEQAQLEQLLAAPLVFYQPVRDADTWQAPNTKSIQVVKVRDIRSTQVAMVAVNPQPIDPIAVPLFVT